MLTHFRLAHRGRPRHVPGRQVHQGRDQRWVVRYLHNILHGCLTQMKYASNISYFLKNKELFSEDVNFRWVRGDPGAGPAPPTLHLQVWSANLRHPHKYKKDTDIKFTKSMRVCVVIWPLNYRHDLKIYASDEGRVQMTAAAFAKGLLALEVSCTLLRRAPHVKMTRCTFCKYPGGQINCKLL